MQNKKIKKIFSNCFIVCFLCFLYFIYLIENTENFVKTKKNYKNIGFKENRYGLYLSNFYANINGDYNQLSQSYNEAVRQNKEDFLGKLFILKSIKDNKDDILKFALEENKKNPDNIIPIIYLSYNNFINKEYEKADNLLKNLKDKSNNVVIKLLRSWILLAQNKNEEALDLLETEIENKAFRKYILMHIAALSELSDEYDYANEIYEEVLLNEIPNIFDIENIASFYIRQNNKDKAIEVLKDFYDKTPDSISAYILYNNVKNNIYTPVSIDTVNKGMGKAIFDISSILNIVFTSSQDLYLMYLSMIDDLYPDFFMPILIKSEIYKKLNRNEEFFELVDKIPQSHYLYMIGQINKANFLLKNKEVEQGFYIIDNLISKNPNYPHLYINLAKYYFNNKKYKKAEEYYFKSLNLTNNNNLKANIYFYLAQIYDIQKDIEKTKINLESSFNLNNKDHIFLNYYGYFLTINNFDIDKGILLISQALMKDSFNPYYIDSYGWALFKKGEIDKALTMIEFAKSIQPKNPVIIDHLADIYWYLGRKREAIYEWKKVLTFNNVDNKNESVNINEIEYKINYGL